MKINQAIKKLNEDYETLDRIDGEAVIDPTTAKAKKEAEEGKKNVEKVMKETTPEKEKEPKMPKTKDLKAMGLQEAYNDDDLREFVSYITRAIREYDNRSHSIEGNILYVYDDDGEELVSFDLSKIYDDLINNYKDIDSESDLVAYFFDIYYDNEILRAEGQIKESLNEAGEDVTPLLKRNLLRAKRNIATDEDLKLREDIDDEVFTFPEDDTNEWDISSTNNLELFADSFGYYKTLAKLQLKNFGKIYYWTNTLEPLEIEDVINFVLEEE